LCLSHERNRCAVTALANALAETSGIAPSRSSSRPYAVVRWSAVAYLSAADETAMARIRSASTTESLHGDGFAAEHIITLGWRGAPDTRIRERLQDEQVLFLTQDDDFLFGTGVSAIVVVSRVKSRPGFACRSLVPAVMRALGWDS
jgi:hypothetical protein